MVGSLVPVDSEWDAMKFGVVTSSESHRVCPILLAAVCFWVFLFVSWSCPADKTVQTSVGCDFKPLQ